MGDRLVDVRSNGGLSLQLWLLAFDRTWIRWLDRSGNRWLLWCAGGE